MPAIRRAADSADSADEDSADEISATSAGVCCAATEEQLRHGGAAVHVPPHGFPVAGRPRNRVSYARSFAGALRGRRGNTGRIAPLWLPPQL
jgi:hypothetical protein